MKLSIDWLRTWAKTTASPQAIGDALTAGGLELESVSQEGDDHWIELGITPNRGDCLSVEGIGREVAALMQVAFMPLEIDPVPATLPDTWEIRIDDPAGCPRYVSRCIRGVNARGETPECLLQRLKSTGMKPVSLIVDIANYVMMELGQPLHVFDAKRLAGGLTVRRSHGEQVTLIDNSTVILDRNTLVIADTEKIVALAGVMGSLNSSVTPETTDIVLESAYFIPSAIRGRARQYRINSDGAVRWERGVDPALADMALERLTALILTLAGGEAGPARCIEAAMLPVPPTITLPIALVTSRLGLKLSQDEIMALLARLKMHCVPHGAIMEVTPPSYRFDIQIPEDLLEEIARVYGYHRIPEVLPTIQPAPTPSDGLVSVDRLKSVLVDRGYQEVITYSFIDEALHAMLFPSITPITLLNPISPDMGVMRYSIWPGLLQTALYNQARQTMSMKLFEVGQCFDGVLPDVRFEERMAGLVCGQHPGFWQQEKPRSYDFYDVKGDVEALLSFTEGDIHFVPLEHPVLAPGQTAAIMKGVHTIGVMGALHPRWVRQLDLRGPVFLFEIMRDPLLEARPVRYTGAPKFPAIYRDLAVVVPVSVHANALIAKVRDAGGGILTNVAIFDVYQGEHVEKGKKSVAMGLILQHSSRTLIEEEVNTAMQAVIHGLKQAFGAIVRE